MAMSEEELMALEREGALIAEKALRNWEETTRLCAGSLEGSIAVITGYMRVVLAGLPEQDPEVVVRQLCAQFVSIDRLGVLPEKILARLRGAKGALS